jgi:HSP20 family protein
MALLKASERMFPTLPSLLDNFLSRDWLDWNESNFSTTNSTLPAVNIRETDESFLIEMAAPGLTKDNFKVHLDRNRLVISSELRNEKNESFEKYSRREFSYQSFQRSFMIPEGTIEGDKISAKYNNGILMITIPKRDEIQTKSAKEIDIM